MIPAVENDEAELARFYRELISQGWSASVALAITSDPSARRKFLAERDGLRDPFTGKRGGDEIERQGLANGLTLKRRRRRGVRA